jgi:hypothetical protein
MHKISSKDRSGTQGHCRKGSYSNLRKECPSNSWQNSQKVCMQKEGIPTDSEEGWMYL